MVENEQNETQDFEAPQPMHQMQPGPDMGMSQPQRARHVTLHQVDACNRALTVIGYPRGEPAWDCSDYRVFGIDGGEADDPQDHGYPLTFQRGPVFEFGRNGLTNEVLLAVVIDRLESFQEGPHACVENSQAISHLRFVLGLMRQRSERRDAAERLRHDRDEALAEKAKEAGDG